MLIILIGNALCTFAISTAYDFYYLAVLRFLNGMLIIIFAIYNPIWIDQFISRSKSTIFMAIHQFESIVGTVLGFLITSILGSMEAFSWRFSFIIQSTAYIVLFVFLLLINANNFNRYYRQNDKSERNEMNNDTKIDNKKLGIGFLRKKDNYNSYKELDNIALEEINSSRNNNEEIKDNISFYSNNSDEKNNDNSNENSNDSNSENNESRLNFDSNKSTTLDELTSNEEQKLENNSRVISKSKTSNKNGNDASNNNNNKNSELIITNSPCSNKLQKEANNSFTYIAEEVNSLDLNDDNSIGNDYAINHNYNDESQDNEIDKDKSDDIEVKLGLITIFKSLLTNKV